jgi:N-acyl-D-aspartate/D-glutamate deacylase
VYDLILKGGDVFDGTGAESFNGDVAIKDGVILAVERDGMLNHYEAEQVVNVAGLVISPGFIDMHTHSDFTLIADGRAESQVHQASQLK